MEEISIRNLRSIVDSGEIKLKPVTIVVGQNSSGKSSFLRLYPLLKQSIEVKTNSPILWYTENVDFGSFEEAVNLNDIKKDIVISLKFNSNDTYESGNRYRYFILGRVSEENIFYRHCDIKIEFYISALNDKHTCYIRKINIVFGDNSIDINYSQDDRISRLIINNSDLTNMAKAFTTYRLQGILPQLGIIDSDGRMFERLTFGGYSVRSKSFYNKLINYIKSLTKSALSNNTISKIIDNLRLGSNEDVLQGIFKCKNLPKSIKTTFSKLDSNSVEVKNINNLLIALYLPQLLEYVDNRINDYFIKSYYIAPVRASAERYYRIQDLAIDEIDSKGRNIPSILKNMENEKRKEFEEWSLKSFGFYPQVKQLEGHLSININNGKIESNMADTGFGYSQILPIIIQMWKIIDEKSSENITFVIEQPELHLHPRLQARLINSLIKMTRIGNGKQFKVIIETHSETIINKIGHLIYNKEIENKDVGVYIFNRNDDGNTEVSESTYDEEGFLENWPIGFFEPEEE